MNAFLAALAAIAVIGVGAYFALQETGFSSSERQAAPSVRLD